MSGDKKFCSITSEDLNKLEHQSVSKSGFSLAVFQQPVIRKRLWQFSAGRHIAQGDFKTSQHNDPSESTSWLYPGESQLFRDILFWKYITDNPALAFPEGENKRILFFDCPTGEEFYSWEILRHVFFPENKNNTIITTQLKSSAALILRKQVVYKKVSSLPALLQNLEKKINILSLLVQKYNNWHLDFEFNTEPEIKICDSITPFASGSFNTIFCRNRLMYYKEEICRIILSNLFRAIEPGGYFIAGTHDSSELITGAGFRIKSTEHGIYQKPA